MQITKDFKSSNGIEFTSFVQPEKGHKEQYFCVGSKLGIKIFRVQKNVQKKELYVLDPFFVHKFEKSEQRVESLAVSPQHQVILFVSSLTPTKFNVFKFEKNKNGKLIGSVDVGEKIKGLIIEKNKVCLLLESKVQIIKLSSNALANALLDISTKSSFIEFSEFDKKKIPNVKEGVFDFNDNILVLPTNNIGEIVLININTKKHFYFKAAKNEVRFVRLDSKSNLLATCSKKGTLLRIFNISKFTQNSPDLSQKDENLANISRLLFIEFRRGVKSAEICSIDFSSNSRLLSCNSTRGTAHVFHVPSLTQNNNDKKKDNKEKDKKEKEKKEKKNVKSSFRKILGPLFSYYASEWSFVNARDPVIQFPSLCRFQETEETKENEKYLFCISRAGYFVVLKLLLDDKTDQLKYTQIIPFSRQFKDDENETTRKIDLLFSIHQGMNDVLPRKNEKEIRRKKEIELKKELKEQKKKEKGRKKEPSNFTKTDLVFGTDLKDLVTYKTKEMEIPYVLYYIKKELEELNYLKTIGIFRKNGMKEEMDKMMLMMNENQKPKSKSVHDYCGLIKSFYRHLPEPVLKNYQTKYFYFKGMKGTSEEDALGVYKELTDEYKKLMNWLLDLFIEIEKNWKSNGMSINSLCSIFAPSLVKMERDEKFSLMEYLSLNDHISIILVKLTNLRKKNTI